MPTSLSAFVTWLQDRCAVLQALEKEAQHALQASASERYRVLMQQKARSLAAIADDAAPVLRTLPPKLAEAAALRLQRFAASANKLWNLIPSFTCLHCCIRKTIKKASPTTLNGFAMRPPPGSERLDLANGQKTLRRQARAF